MASVATSLNRKLRKRLRNLEGPKCGKLWFSITAKACSISKKKAPSTDEGPIFPIVELSTYLTVNAALRVLLLSMKALIAFVTSVWPSMVWDCSLTMSKMVSSIWFEAKAIERFDPLANPSDRCE